MNIIIDNVQILFKILFKISKKFTDCWRRVKTPSSSKDRTIWPTSLGDEDLKGLSAKEQRYIKLQEIRSGKNLRTDDGGGKGNNTTYGVIGVDKFGNEINTDSQGSVVASANKELHSKLISLINE